MIGKDIRKINGKTEDGVQGWLYQIQRAIKLRREEEKRWEYNEEFEDLKQWDGKRRARPETSGRGKEERKAPANRKKGKKEKKGKRDKKAADEKAPVAH